MRVATATNVTPDTVFNLKISVRFTHPVIFWMDKIKLVCAHLT